jgi:hypothetical protein
VSTPRKRETVTVDVPGLRDLIDNASHGRPGPWIRALIEDALQAPERPSTRVSARRSRTDGVKVTLFLHAHEHEALVNGALSERLSQNEYAGRLIAAGPAGAAIVGHEALQLLARSNLQLVKVGMNLSRIALKLDSIGQDEAGVLTAEDCLLLKNAARAALEHVELVAGLVERVGITRRQAARRGRKNHGQDRSKR